MTVTDYLRLKILEDLRVVSCIDMAHASYLDLRVSEWSNEFEEYMRNRLIMGALRYGKMSNPDKARYDFIGAIRSKLRNYEQTGNTENLVDIANYCLLEFTIGMHPTKHFSALDDSEHAREVRV